MAVVLQLLCVRMRICEYDNMRISEYANMRISEYSNANMRISGWRGVNAGCSYGWVDDGWVGGYLTGDGWVIGGVMGG
jgi:hypothetical protein